MDRELRISPTSRKSLPAVREELRLAGLTAENVARIVARPPFPKNSILDESVIAVDRDTTFVEGPAIPPKLHRLLRFFAQHEPLPRGELESVLSTSAIDALALAGVLEESGSCFQAKAYLVEWNGLLLACDPPWLEEQGDTVYFPQSTAAVNFYLPVGVEVRTAVDVGTGCGALALHMARRYGAEVIAIEPTRTAVACCVFNAALNGITSVSAIAADHRELVSNAKFARSMDLFVWNMPRIFTTIADLSLGFRDVGEGERVLGETYEWLPRVLKPTGHAVLRHDSRPERSWFEALLARHGNLQGFQVLLRRESDAARGTRPDPSDDEYASRGIAMIAPRNGDTAPVSFLEYDSWDEMLSASRSEWQRAIRDVAGWSDYKIELG